MKGPSRELSLYQHAAERKAKLLSSKEIGEAQGLEKIRRKFWNEKAEELCQDRALKKWKATAIHGVIDTTWMLKKLSFWWSRPTTPKIKRQRKKPQNTP